MNKLNVGGEGGSGSLPNGGTMGQVLTKESNADGDADWEDAGIGADMATQTELDAAIAGLSATYQPLDADLIAIAAVSPSNDDVLQRKSGSWINRTLTQLKADLFAIVGLEVLESLTVDQAAPGGGSVEIRSSPSGSNAVIEVSTPFGSSTPLLNLNNANGQSAVHVDSAGAFTLPLKLGTPAANGTAAAIARTFIAASTIAVGDPVKIGSAGTVTVADATNSDVCHGVATQAASSTDPCLVVLFGVARHDAWAWTPGGPVYLGAGVLTQTAPSGTDDTVQIVGIAEHADRILVMPGFSYATHA